MGAGAGVRPTESSPSDLEFSWGKNGTFATKDEASKAFLETLSKVRRLFLRRRSLAQRTPPLLGAHTCGGCGAPLGVAAGHSGAPGRSGHQLAPACDRAACLGLLLQADVVIDETYSEDPKAYNLDTFLTEYGIDPNSAEAKSLPWLASKKARHNGRHCGRGPSMKPSTVPGTCMTHS